MKDSTIMPSRQTLASEYIVPPFSILDTRSGRWQSRKRQWLSMGLGETKTRTQLTFSGDGCDDSYPARAFEAKTSVFDPVLSEVLTHWFSESGDLIVDPFCGGPVRGAVAAQCGRRYMGFDIRPEQIRSNDTKWNELLIKGPRPIWSVGDARDIGELKERADLILTCPPYGNLEVYSNNPKDLSTMTQRAFNESMDIVIQGCTKILNESGILALVVGDYRRDGGLVGFPAFVVASATRAGLKLWNHAILLNRAGSAPLRAGGTFGSFRKLVMMHQHVLIFVNGKCAKRWQKQPFNGPKIRSFNLDLFDVK